jgi:hypothetical protein
MWSRRLVTDLLGLSVVAVLMALGTEAGAGNCSKPPCASVKWYSSSCVCCSTGSEVFGFTALGVPGWFVKNCPAGQNCLKCSVSGTDASGGIEGVLFCVNHGGNAATAQGQPFTIPATMSADGNFSKCDKAGKCTGSIQVTGDLSSLSAFCQNPNWTAVAFTASKFNGQCCSCDNGYDDIGTCCATADRVEDPLTGNMLCTSTGTPTCSGEFQCSINPVPKPGNMQPYQCCALSEIDPATGLCPQ